MRWRLWLEAGANNAKHTQEAAHLWRIAQHER